MDKETYVQQRLPGLRESPRPTQPPAEQPTPSEKKPKFYTLKAGGTIFSGPVGGDRPSVSLGQAQTDMKVKKLLTFTQRGTVSHLVEVESPPELAGQRFYVAQKDIPGNGFI